MINSLLTSTFRACDVVTLSNWALIVRSRLCSGCPTVAPSRQALVRALRPRVYSAACARDRYSLARRLSQVAGAQGVARSGTWPDLLDSIPARGDP
jgi:hypothetical protein